MTALRLVRLSFILMMLVTIFLACVDIYWEYYAFLFGIEVIAYLIVGDIEDALKT